jgi:hypothetical protein
LIKIIAKKAYFLNQLNTNFMNYLLLLLPVSFFVLSYVYRCKYQKFQNSGLIPVILSAKRNTQIFLMLGVTLTFIVLIAMNADLFTN